jgi:molybdopterin synthase catalytic subunit
MKTVDVSIEEALDFLKQETPIRKKEKADAS